VKWLKVYALSSNPNAAEKKRKRNPIGIFMGTILKF
jgi:hypothetical protein